MIKISIPCTYPSLAEFSFRHETKSFELFLANFAISFCISLAFDFCRWTSSPLLQQSQRKEIPGDVPPKLRAEPLWYAQLATWRVPLNKLYLLRTRCLITERKTGLAPCRIYCVLTCLFLRSMSCGASGEIRTPGLRWQNDSFLLIYIVYHVGWAQ